MTGRDPHPADALGDDLARGRGPDPLTIVLAPPRASCASQVWDDLVVIVDRDEGRSVMNDAHAVIEALVGLGVELARRRVIYRDTDRLWDELLVRDGRFVGFAPLHRRRLEDAVAAVGGRPRRRAVRDRVP